MVIDDEVGLWQQAGEVVRLDVDQGDAIEPLHLFGREHFDLQVEQLEHPEVFRTADAVETADDGGLSGAAEDVAKREAARDGVRVRVVVEQDQDAVGVREVALILLNLSAGSPTAQAP